MNTKKRYPVHVRLNTQPMGVFQSLKAVRNNVLSIIPEIAVKQPIVSGKTGVRWHMVMDPVALRRILLEQVEQYPKSLVTKNLLRPAIGESLFIAEGAHWRWQRRAAAPVFSRRNVMNLGPVMTEAAEKSCDRLAAQDGAVVDLYEDMIRTTFDVAAAVTFSGDGPFDPDGVHKAINSYMAAAAKMSIFDMFGLPDWVPRPSRVFAGNALSQMKRIADEAVEARRASGPGTVPDLLDLLLAGEDPETHRQMNTAELRDNLLTFIVAGHETTALTLAWSLYLCAFDEDIQQKARDEACRVLAGRAATAEDVDQLPYTRMIVDEALRLYPPAGFLSRTAQRDDVLCGRTIRRKDTVMIPVYALQRHELLWEDPNAFRPERFTERSAIDRYSYLPFGDGPRICIGASFALQEAVIVLATLLSRFRFSAIDGVEPDPRLILTLRPEGGVNLRVHQLRA